jgi:hypothetical protein
LIEEHFMAHRMFIGLASVGLVLLGGCATRDARDKDPICGVHQIAMETRTVPIHYGLRAGPDREFAAARATDFPHAPTFVGGGCMVGREKSALVWACPSCEAARDAWLAGHLDVMRDGYRRPPAR